MNGVFSLIANENPDAANQICAQYGYDTCESQDEMAASLQEISNEYGVPAFKQIMAIHPDKDIILDLFRSTTQAPGCANCHRMDTALHQTNTISAANGTAGTMAPSNNTNQQQSYWQLVETNKLLVIGLVTGIVAVIFFNRQKN